MARAAIGIIRVSRVGKRKGDSFVSPAEQRGRIEEACERDGLELRSVAEEIDVSGGKALDERDGLRAAVTAVEAGEADVVVVAYFDRLFRSLVVQAEVLSRIEAAGGEVLALDFGKVSEGSAGEWLSGTMMGAFAEYQRRSIRERSGAAQADAVRRGVPPFPSIPPGLERGPDRRLVPSPDAPAVVRAFEMRSEGESIKGVRAYLRDNGIELSYRQVQTLLASPLLVGEIRFGDLVNPEAHEPIVNRELWNRVQRVKTRRGGRDKSDRLLARLGVLRCGTCGSRMVVGTAHHGEYPLYRCSPTLDCPRRVTVSATLVEEVVEKTVKEALLDVEGRASVEANARNAERKAAIAQERLDAAIRALADFSDEAAAQETLATLRSERDAALEAVDQLGSKAASLGLTGADWDSLLPQGKRDLIRATVDRVEIAPGRGPDRIAVHLFV